MKKYAFIFVLCFIPRLLYLIITHPTIGTNLYWRLSESLLRWRILGFDGLKSTTNEPLYPLFLAFSRWLAGDNFFLVLTSQILIACLGCVYLYKLSFLLSKSHPIARLAVFFYSFYPYFIRQSSAVGEVTLLTTLLIMSVYYYSNSRESKNAFFCGVAFGLAALARTVVLPIWLMSIAALVWKRKFLSAILLSGTTFFLVALLFFRNFQIDKSIFPSRSGINLFKGNCKFSDQIIPAYSVDLLNGYVFQVLREKAPELESGNENRLNQFFTDEAFKFMKENPIRTMKLKVLNVIYLFYPRIVPFHPMGEAARVTFQEGKISVNGTLPRSATAEWAHSIFYSFILAAAIFGIYLRRREFSNDLILYFIILSFTIIYSLYWPATRLRAPMDFVLMFYAASALNLFWCGLSRRD